MTYSVKWHPQAIKVVEKLQKSMIERVLSKLDDVSEEPFRFLERFEGQSLFKLRVGDYRALIEVDQKNQVLLIQVFEHRSKVYKQG
ncbi:MAG: type II toxin-antitoxin system RelE/ParE family toxin [Candidatus Woesearchaeota archaeon]